MTKQALWNKKISILSGLLVGCLALFAFVLSYEALWTLALDSDIPSRLAWLFPLTIDFFVIVASLSILRHSLSLESKRLAWWLLIVYSGLSIVFNAVHKGLPLEVYEDIRPWVRIAVYIVPPVSLVFSLHLLIRQVESRLISSLSNLTRGDTATITVAAIPDTWTNGDAIQYKPGSPADKLDKVTERRQGVLSLLDEGWSDSDIASYFDVSLKTIERDKKALLNGKGV